MRAKRILSITLVFALSEKVLLVLGSIPLELKRCVVLERVNRFVVNALTDCGVAPLNLRNTGRLLGLLLRGSEALYKPKSSGKTRGYLVAVKVEGGYAILDTQVQAMLWELALSRGLLEALRGFRVKRRNFRFQGSLIDYFLEGEKGDLMLLEVKSAVHVEGSMAMYPDAPSERGRRHIEVLIEAVKKGFRAVVCFIASHPSAKAFRAFREVDPLFSSKLSLAVKRGVEVMALNIYLTEELQVALIPQIPVTSL